MLKIGIVGCGTIAKARHIPEIIANPDCELAAIFTATPGKAKKEAEKYGAVGYEDWNEFLNSGIDAAVICTPNYLHASQTIDCLNHGMHVLIEKPMAASVEEAEEMVKTAEEKGLQLMVALNQRLTAVHKEVHDSIAAGKIGDILCFDTVYCHGGPEEWSRNNNPWFFDKGRSAQGAMADLGIHKLDLMHYLLGEHIVKVSAMLRTKNKTYPDGTLINVEDNAFCLVETESGIPGTVHIGWTEYGNEVNSVHIQGSRGCIKCMMDKDNNFIMEVKGEEPVLKNFKSELTNEEVLAGMHLNSYIMDSFVDCILGRTENPISGKEALCAQKVVDAAAKSSKLGTFVEIQ